MENKFVTYLKGVKAEWGKITWPEKKQVIVQTIIVLLVVICFTTYTYLLDIIFEFVIDKIVGFIGFIK